MTGLDPLEQTQENLHPVIVAHRARDAARPGRGRLRGATILTTTMLVCAFALFAWLL